MVAAASPKRGTFQNPHPVPEGLSADDLANTISSYDAYLEQLLEVSKDYCQLKVFLYCPAHCSLRHIRGSQQSLIP